MQIPSINPYSKAEIIKETEVAWQKLVDFVQPLSPDAFYHKPSPEIWSVAENMEHLFLSTKPLVGALKLPKLTFKAFGTPNRASRSYEEVQSRYHEKLAAAGNIDQKDYGPKVAVGGDIQEKLDDWQSIGKKYLTRIDSWKEEDLDKYLLPHPLLGRLIVREMLFFTTYHTYHHLQIMHERAGQVS